MKGSAEQINDVSFAHPRQSGSAAFKASYSSFVFLYAISAGKINDHRSSLLR